MSLSRATRSSRGCMFLSLRAVCGHRLLRNCAPVERRGRIARVDLEDHDATVSHLVFTPDGKSLVSADMEGRVCVHALCMSV
ncbi:hypothetical protein C8T65DRAFT_675981, partial [Cerioporus squamosus]